MRRLNPQKLHVRYLPGTEAEDFVLPRRYTLTHSDLTGDLYLTIGPVYDAGQVSGRYTRFMRDEVLAEWVISQGSPVLELHCHVSGGLVFGWAGLRNAIFRREMPLVLEALRFGDSLVFSHHPELDKASIEVHFHAAQERYDVVEHWGKPADYRE
jgi:hypothetical protein